MAPKHNVYPTRRHWMGWQQEQDSPEGGARRDAKVTRSAPTSRLSTPTFRPGASTSTARFTFSIPLAAFTSFCRRRMALSWEIWVHISSICAESGHSNTVQNLVVSSSTEDGLVERRLMWTVSATGLQRTVRPGTARFWWEHHHHSPAHR